MKIENTFNFKNKTVLVTGGGGSIGKGAAVSFAKCGANVIVADIDIESGKKTVREISKYNGQHMFIKLNLRDISTVKEMVKVSVEKYGKIDILINHAGINIRKDIIDYTENDWDIMIDVNLKGFFFVAQEIGKQMLKQKNGKIVNTSSVSAIRAKKQLSIYSATKGAILQLTKAMAHEWAEFGINVNCIGPGYTKTKQTKSLLENKIKSKELLDKIPQKRFGEIDDMVFGMLFLSSEYSSYINGQIIYIDGGRLVD